MKYLDMPSLGRLTSMLTDCTMGDQMLNGRIEAFSCKKAGDDKRLSKSLNEKFQRKRKRSRGESVSNNLLTTSVPPSTATTATTAAGVATAPTTTPNGNSANVLATRNGAAALVSNSSGSSSINHTQPLSVDTTRHSNRTATALTAAASATAVAIPVPTAKRPRSNSSSRQKMSRQTSSHSFEQAQSKVLVPTTHAAHASDLSVGESGSTSKITNLHPSGDEKARKRIIDLISTLNAMHDDYDFSESLSEQFVQHRSINDIIPIVNKNVAEVMELRVEGFLNQLWSEINKAIQVRDCQVYSYLPADGDPFCGDGVMWSFNYFFYNNDLNRILCFSCTAQSKWSDSGGRRTPGALDKNNNNNAFGSFSSGSQMMSPTGSFVIDDRTPNGSPLPSPSTTPGGGLRNSTSPFNFGHGHGGSSLAGGSGGSQGGDRASPNDDDDAEAYDVADHSGEDEEE